MSSRTVVARSKADEKRPVSRLPAVNSSKFEIRLLELLPDRQRAPVRCNFRVEALNDASISYVALSYAWAEGDPSVRKTIFVDNQPVEVSWTLFGAIQRLRPSRSGQSLFLWVDALCINQDDPLEKTQQVDIMHRIYTQCAEVAVWLGGLGDVPPDHAQAAFDTVSWIAGERASPPWENDDDPFCTPAVAASALKTALTIRWWSRIWTVQETILPPAGSFYWGPCAPLARATLERASESFFDGTAPDGLPAPLWTSGALADLQAGFRGLAFSRDEPPLRLLWRWRFRGASDARDKVYGLLGVRRERDAAALPSLRSCDYTVDAPTVFARLAADLIRGGGDLLPLVGRRGEARPTPGVPSWAVDWVPPPDPADHCSEFWEHHRRWHGLSFCADKGVRGVGDGLRVLDERVLHLDGVFVGKVAAVEPLGGAVRADASFYELLLSRADVCAELVQNFQQRYPGVLSRDWMRTLWALLMGKLVPEDPDHGDTIDDWVPTMTQHHSVFITEEGRFGLGPRTVEPGHEVWIVGGSRFPLLLQRREGPCQRDQIAEFIFEADCFVYGIMRGEAVHGKSQVPLLLH